VAPVMKGADGMNVGIESMNVYAGRAVLNVADLARARGLDPLRFANLLMDEKSVALHFEDPVSFAVNAARPLVERLTPAERARIRLLITATESGLDFGKSLSTYVHHHLGLGRNCRLFEVKQACFAGTAALATAADFARANPGSRALVITTDLARPIPHTYAEPSQGAAAVALLVGDTPRVLTLEPGAWGAWAYEVMDSCRPTAEIETGDADLSLLTYLDCIENAFQAYCGSVGAVDFATHFDYLAMHTPFGAMAKGAHRTMMRKLKRLPPPAIEEDFRRRLEPSLKFCRRVGNIYSGTLFLALAGVIAGGDFPGRKRVGLFSYGSGCASEFYSGTADADSVRAIGEAGIAATLDDRHTLSMAEYERLIPLCRGSLFGVMDATTDRDVFIGLYRERFAGRRLLVLRGIENYHRVYDWT